jgi:tripartite-type tricarboxylate transporter receptor subunit TctC
MLRQCMTALIFPLAITVINASVVYGQDYPVRPIRVVTGSVGGSSDFTARLLAQGISGPLGQQVIIDNRANGLMRAEMISKAPPDGYNLLLAGGTFLTVPLLEKVTYDPVRDFAPITLVEMSPSIVAVHPSVPAKSIKELIAFAKAKPGGVNYGGSGLGGTAHLATELFNSMAGIKMVYVPYKGTGQAVSGLISGEVQVIIVSATVAEPHNKTGKLRSLAVTSLQPSALAPGLPTVSGSGVSGYESVGITGLFAPAKTPAVVIKKLNQELVRFLRTPAATEAFLKSGVEIVGNSPEQFAASIKTEMDRMSKLIKDIGLRVP